MQEGSGVAIDEDGRMIDEASARAARTILAYAGSSE
jgi:citrate lyase beta subunit